MKIIFDCGSGGPDYPWNITGLGEGLGGSEESLCLYANEICKSATVDVYNNCDSFGTTFHSDNFDDLLVSNGCTFIPYNMQSRDKCDIYVAWRDTSLIKNSTGKITVFWSHDIPVAQHFNLEDFEGVDYIWCLNQYHADLYIEKGVSPDKIYISQNAIDIEPFFPKNRPARIPGRCIYLSHPDRGLKELHKIWHQVREHCEFATLQACWWEEDKFLEPNEDIGILPMKHCGNEELAYEILQSEVFSYPSVFSPEISPSSCIKAQLGGAIPIIVPQGGMIQVTHYGHKTDMRTFPIALANALNDDAYRNDQREEMISWAKERFDSKNVVDKWLKHWQQKIQELPD